MTLLRSDLLRDLLFLWNPRERVLHTCMSVGMDVCGHPSIVHGGFTSGEARPQSVPQPCAAGSVPALTGLPSVSDGMQAGPFTGAGLCTALSVLSTGAALPLRLLNQAR